MVALTTIIEPLSAKAAAILSSETSALCPCEGLEAVLARKFLRCTVCDHTICGDHGGNCKHTYRMEDTSNRKLPMEFHKRIKVALPKMIKFANTSLDSVKEASSSKIGPKKWQTFADGFDRTVSGDFYLTDITRSDICEILYLSATGKLRLEISAKHVRWYLYGTARSETELQDAKGTQLDTIPIARCNPTQVEIAVLPKDVGNCGCHRSRRYQLLSASEMASSNRSSQTEDLWLPLIPTYSNHAPWTSRNPALA